MKRAYNNLDIFLFFADIVLVTLSFYAAQRMRLILPFGAPITIRGVILPTYVYLIAIGIWAGSLISVNAYHPQKILKAVDETKRVLLASVQAVMLLAGFFYIFYREFSRLQFLYFSVSTTLLILFYRLLIRLYYRLRSRTGVIEPERHRVLIVGAGELGVKVAKLILQRSRWGVKLFGLLDDDLEKKNWQPDGLEGKSVIGTLDQLSELVDDFGITEVYLALPARAFKKLENIVVDLQDRAVRVNVVPDYFSLAMIYARPDVLGGLPVIRLRDPVIVGTDRIIKRIFDVLVSLSVFLLLWPLYILIILLIRLDSPGPAIFKQQRVGENGRLFTMYKFRTMVQDAEQRQNEINLLDEDGNIIHKRPDDPRVTRLGHFLRRTSLDELPQFFNVLKGDMSVVGPRPELPWLVDKYEHWQRKRFAVPQGITGWWQVNKRSEELMHLSTKDDLYYVYNYSFLLDIRIILMTVKTVFKGF